MWKIPDLRRAYEERLSKLQKQELELEDSLVALDRPKSNFHDMFEPAMEVLANSHKIWKNGSYAWRRAILRLAFASDVVYAHDEGLRTAEISFPFQVLASVSAGDPVLVEPRGSWWSQGESNP
jgi:site-specific DNA recombinase